MGLGPAAAAPTWTLDDSLPGLTTGSNELRGADCTSGTCYVAGDHSTARDAHDSVPVIDFEPSGGSWTQAEVAPPAGSSGFDNGLIQGVTCSAQDTCAAWGGEVDTESTVVQPFVVIGSQGSWQAFRPPVPTDFDPSNRFAIGAGSCKHATCAVVGSYPVGSKKRVFVDSYRAGVWTMRYSALLNGGNRGGDEQFAITCATTSVCYAYGRDGRKTPAVVTVPVKGAGSPVEQKLPWTLLNPKDNVVMTDLACTSASTCFATAYEFLPALEDQDPGPPFSYYESLSKGVWTKHPFAVPQSLKVHEPSTEWTVLSIDCASTGTCYALGSLDATWHHKGSGTKDAATVTRLAGSTRSTVFAAVPDPGTGTSGVGEPFCNDQPTCIAFGSQHTPGTGSDPGTDQPFTVHIGTKEPASTYEYPTFDNGQNILSADACASPDRCVIAGTTFIADGSDNGKAATSPGRSVADELSRGPSGAPRVRRAASPRRRARRRRSAPTRRGCSVPWPGHRWHTCRRRRMTRARPRGCARSPRRRDAGSASSASGRHRTGRGRCRRGTPPRRGR